MSTRSFEAGEISARLRSSFWAREKSSTASMESNVRAARAALLLCRWPMRCQVAVRSESVERFPSHSWTRFSPKWRVPARWGGWESWWIGGLYRKEGEWGKGGAYPVDLRSGRV